MSIIHLSESWSQQLAQLPESGMGFQKVDIILRNRRVLKDVVVFNAEDCEVNEPFDPADIIEIKLSKRVAGHSKP